MKVSLAILAAMVSATAWAQSSGAWAYIPLAQRVAETDLVVAAKLARLGEIVKLGRDEWQAGTLEVAEVLKGDKAAERITLLWHKPIGNGAIADGPVPYRVGLDGIWILCKRPDKDAYTASYPGDFQLPGRKDNVRRTLDRLAKLKWGQAAHGVSLAVLVVHWSLRGSVVRIRGKQVDVKERLEVIVFARNTGERVVHLLDYPPDQPVELQVKDPDGQPVEVRLYPESEKGREPMMGPWCLKSVAPGQVRGLRHHALPLSTKAGVYTIGAAYENRRDPKELKVGPIWQGRIAAPTLEEKVPQEQ